MDDQVKESIAAELNVDAAELTSKKPLVELEYWDSVMVLSVMVILSEALGTEIAPEEMARLDTFGDIETLWAAKAC